MTTIDVTLRIGGVFASQRAGVIRTVLGSCIAVCLFDPVSRVGGMNHFMLPRLIAEEPSPRPTVFGVQAMEVLIGAMQRLGARRDRMVAKLFGGAHVLQTSESASSVPARNVAFIEAYMRDERMEVTAHDLGGYLPRCIHFHPHNGKAFVRRMGSATLDELRLEESLADSRPASGSEPDITLF
ncbi:MAG TPA: chemotaxis protein CheD [Polyangiales bacterium]